MSDGSDHPGDSRSADPRTWFGPEDGPWFEHDDWEDRAHSAGASAERVELARAMRTDGFAVLAGAVPATVADRARAAVEPYFAAGREGRMTNAAWALPAVRDVALAPAVLDAVAFLYGRRPVPFQTLDFATGTEQAAHRDDEHFDSLPPRFMCGAWVALEDVGPDQGPVSYWPGSQLTDAGADPATAVAFTAGRGDVLLWSARLLHGGSPIQRAGASRWSQVTHYLFDGCCYYTPRRSDHEAGLLEVRRPLVDIGTRRVVPHRLAGRPARYVVAPDGRARLLGPDAPDPAATDRIASWIRRLPKEVRGRGAPIAARVLRRPPPG